MKEYEELLEKLGKLKRNEAQMSQEQRERYAPQLEKMRKRIQSLALTFGRSFLFYGMVFARGDETEVTRVRAVLLENEIRDAERDALAVLFSSYDFDEYLRVLLPVQIKLFHLGYGPYWVRHCREVSDKDSEAEFSHYNDLIDMYWVPAWHEWKRKDKWEVTVMLPPTMEEIREVYEKECEQCTKKND